MSAQTLLGRKNVEDLGFILSHEHLKINFEVSFHSSPLCPLPTDYNLKLLTLPDSAFVRQYPYHFRNNLDYSDYNAALESLVNYKNLGGGTIVEVSTVGLQRDPEICAKLSEESGINVVMDKFS